MKFPTIKEDENAGFLSTLIPVLLGFALLSGCDSSDGNGAAVPPPPPPPPPPVQQRAVTTGTDLNTLGSPLLNLNAQGPGGSPNQSLRGGDVLQGDESDEVIIGGLGIDTLLGEGGDDVLIGGTEDFNSSVDGDDRGSDNRDRAFGGEGDDVFIWAPGDGSDFFDGGEGTDVVVFGVIGEQRDSDGSTAGAPFFNVNPPGSDGSQDFDDVHLDADSRLPTVSVSGSPGFCTVLDESTNPTELQTLALDKLIRFSLRGVANSFDDGTQSEDDGLRVAVGLRGTEFVVCTKRDVVDGAGADNIEVLDLRTSPPTPAAIEDLPQFVQDQLT